MAYVSRVLGFAPQQPHHVHHHAIHQPFAPPLFPLHFFMAQVHYPVGVMAMPPTLMLISPTTFPQSILPPGAPLPPSSLQRRDLALRIVFYGHDLVPALRVTNAAYTTSPPFPRRDGLLADIASWAGHHGLAIRHAGGRIDPSKVNLYVLPRGRNPHPGEGEGGFFGLHVVPGAGLAIPGDVVRVVRLEGVEERDWVEALREIQREGYEAVVAVDMGVSVSGGDSEPATTAADADPAPAASVGDADADADQEGAAAAAAAAAA